MSYNSNVATKFIQIYKIYIVTHGAINEQIKKMS